MENRVNRKLAASIAKQLIAKKITYKQFVDTYPEVTKDKEIDELFSLIEHEPGVGGLFGVSKDRASTYKNKILELIELLEK